MTDTPAQIQLALVSHTNNGKTTLARTLTGMDVGEVRDAAHVTVVSESHPLLTTDAGDALYLWDTPGFGDSLRLMRRLALSGNPIGWILREVIDRYRDRPLWLSQQALRTAKDTADVVLYLVNASESPEDAGYLASEMKILEWLGKPVAVLLNQMGPPRPVQDELAERERWKAHLAQYTVVKEVLALDAFARCWVHEHVFYEAIGALIEPSKSAGYQRLVAAWRQNNARRFQESMQLLAQQLAAAAADSQTIAPDNKTLIKSAMKNLGLARTGSSRVQNQAMEALVGRLEQGISHTTTRLLALYKIDPSEAARINARVRDNFVVKAPVDKAQAGLLGAVMSGAATGLSADLMAGGLTLGGGALIGSIVGALGFAGAAWGFNLSTDRSAPMMRLSDEFLQTLTATSVLRYLAVIHFGRGRGNFVESEAPAFWQEEVNVVLAAASSPLQSAFEAARSNPEKGLQALQELVEGIVSASIQRLYPDAMPGGFSA